MEHRIWHKPDQYYSNGMYIKMCNYNLWFKMFYFLSYLFSWSSFVGDFEFGILCHTYVGCESQRTCIFVDVQAVIYIDRSRINYHFSRGIALPWKVYHNLFCFYLSLILFLISLCKSYLTILLFCVWIHSLIGGIVISIGFYMVLWGKAKEDKVDKLTIESSPSQKAPLLGN